MKNKFLFFCLLSLFLISVCSCDSNKCLPPFYGSFCSDRSLDIAEKSFGMTYKDNSQKYNMEMKNLYGTFYIPNSFAENILLDDLIVNSQEGKSKIHNWYWRYGVYSNNGEYRKDSTYHTINALGEENEKYYYSSLDLRVKYINNDFYSGDSKSIGFYFEFYNLYDVIDLELVTPIKERKYFARFGNSKTFDITEPYKNTIVEELCIGNQNALDLLLDETNSVYELYVYDSYYIEKEGVKIPIAEFQIKNLQLSYFSGESGEVNLTKSDLLYLVSHEYEKSQKEYVFDFISDEIYKFFDGTFDKYYFEYIINENV